MEATMKLAMCSVMKETKYKLRCRNKGILVTSEPEKYNVVWKRIFNPEIYSIDKTLKA